MSQEKAQLIAPLGVMAVEGMNASGVITATSLDGNIVGSAKSLVNGANVSVGVITATSFTGNLTGNIARLADSAPDVDAGVTTATSFVGNLTGSVTDLTSAPAITVGMVTATTLEGPVTGNVTGNVSGLAGGLGVNYNGGWTGAGTSQINAGVVTATTFYGDGSNLDGVASGPVSQQSIGITSATTAIDLSNGNLIHANQSSNTTVSFANTANGNVYFIREKDATTTARTITWPDRIKWDGGSAPTLISSNSTDEGQIFLLVTRDMGVTWYGKEVYENAAGETLWGWGNDGTGGWGDNTSGNPVYSGTTKYSSPTQLPGGNSWVYQGTEEMEVVIKNDGTMWGWGNQGEGGNLGLNDNKQRSSPTQVGTDNTWAYTVGQYSGQLAQKTDGTLWGWGHNSVGQVGDNSVTQRSSPVQIGTETTWALGKNKFDTRAHSAAIKTDGTLWTWGENGSGELGLNNTTDYSSPKQVGTETTWAHLNLMSGMMAATKTDGTLWTWGTNASGELGHNSRTSYSSPKQVGTATDWDGSKMTCRSASTYGAIKNTNELWVWGFGGAGALGDNATVDRSSPVQIPGSWKQGCMQQIVSSCVKTDGTLWTWGRNQNGNLGTNNQQPGDGAQSSPVQVGTATDWVNVQFNSQMTTASRSS